MSPHIITIFVCVINLKIFFYWSRVIHNVVLVLGIEQSEKNYT